MPWNKPYNPPRDRRLTAELYTHANRVYFITIRAFKHQSPFVRTDLNQRILDLLSEEQERQQCRIFTYCIMPDHLHYLISPAHNGTSILKFTDQFKGKSTNQSWEFGWQGKLWQSRYYDHVVRREESLNAIAEYILNNPVRKKLVPHANQWPWSGHLNPLPD